MYSISNTVLEEVSKGEELLSKDLNEVADELASSGEEYPRQREWQRWKHVRWPGGRSVMNEEKSGEGTRNWKQAEA